MPDLVPARELETETRVSNSRFIASIKAAQTRTQAEQYLQAIQARYPDASHHVPAYIIGHGKSVLAHSSDDGEPSGTAGRPALAVLHGSNLGDTVLVITRYFGGTKLGTGGLVKAYGDAARRAVLEVPKAQKIQAQLLETEIEYPVYEQLTQIIQAYGGSVQREKFHASVSVTFLLPRSELPAFSREFNSLTRGQASLHTIDPDRAALVAVNPQSKSRKND